MINFYLHNDQGMWGLWRVDISAKALFLNLTFFDFTAPNATVIYVAIIAIIAHLWVQQRPA